MIMNEVRKVLMTLIFLAIYILIRVVVKIMEELHGFKSLHFASNKKALVTS